MLGRRTARSVVAVATASALVMTALPAVAGGSGAVLRRTGFGVPHVLAGSYHAAGVGAGYAFAEDNLCLLAQEIVTLDGERARWFGPGDGNLEADLYHRWINQTGVVEAALASRTGPSRNARDLARGYADGYNRYLAETGVDALPESACTGAGWVRPITELDIWRRVLQIADMGGAEGVTDLIAAAQPPGTPAVASRTAPTGLPDVLGGGIGSNAVGLGADATTGRTGMLLANPHFPWQGSRRFHQVHITIPGELNVSGVSLPGLPGVAIGHTDRVAWTHTVSTAVTVTLHRLALTPGDPTRYVVDGQTRALRRDPVTVTVRQDDGTLTTVTQPVWSTPDGPIVAVPGALPWDTAQAFQLRSANAGNLRTVDQWIGMAKARDVRQLRDVQARLLASPWVNTTAADVTGTAFYGDLQVVPHVTNAQEERCGLGDLDGIPVLDGSRGDCAWGTDADAPVPGLFGAGNLPTLFRRDVVSNMNDSPWLANPAAPLTGYPAIVGSVGTERSYRTRMGLQLIAEGIADSGFTLPELQAMQLNNRNLTAERGLPSVRSWCDSAAPAPSAPASDGRAVDLTAACAALAGWNGRGDLDARGAALWRVFVLRLRTSPWTVPFDPADPVGTPRGFDATRPGVITALADAVRAFAAAGVPVDVRLGDAQRYEGIGVHGCDGREGCFNVITADVTRPATGVQHGSSFIMATELTRSGPRTRTLLTYGQSANPTSPHHTDQTLLYVDKEWVTERFTEREIASDPHLTVRHLP
ncbi:penicillin acylase family protein [Catenuloplanes atrovinosus]|uniref:Acyl-homoserine-lactone acylase n=1 Tax=Catenuloplanes atrovinosus TaxID=137266 RepID=A0AAE3YNK4_9ACTN|nr:penicillin acylase family protein [Catenuloplanes atrovinosus]MDR7275800.1 acyl-homoserine-lactone acylase [Catenuloplanes atrovinosus]